MHYIDSNFVTTISQELAKSYRCPLDVTNVLSVVYNGIKNALHDSILQAVVALTRHTKGCIYYTETNEGSFAEQMKVMKIPCLI